MEEEKANATGASIDVDKGTQDEVVKGNNFVKFPRGQTDESDHAETFSIPPLDSISDSHEEGEATCAGSNNVQEDREDEETNNIVDEDHIYESGEINPDDAGQFVRKCSQGFGFFVS